MRKSLQACLLATALAHSSPGQTLVYFGTNASGEGSGIYVSTLDEATGVLSPSRLAAKAERPSFLVIGPGGSRLYSVTELNRAGAVAAFAIQPDGELARINVQSSEGKGPCHISLDRTGRTLMVANYGDGSIASYPVLDDGSIGAAATTFRNTGSSVHPTRQNGPHAHSINADPENRRAYVADLGTDQILIFDLEPITAKLIPNATPFASMPAGGGPRHLAFHPSAPFAFGNLELTSETVALRWDRASGQMLPLQTVSTLPPQTDATGNTTAEILAHPSGKFLYVSNRGHDSIAVFAIDAATGLLELRGNVSTEGRTPRNFGITPSGAYLIAVNQDTDNAVTFRIDQESGMLTRVGAAISLPRPVCVRFLVR